MEGTGIRCSLGKEEGEISAQRTVRSLQGLYSTMQLDLPLQAPGNSRERAFHASNFLVREQPVLLQHLLHADLHRWGQYCKMLMEDGMDGGDVFRQGLLGIVWPVCR